MKNVWLFIWTFFLRIPTWKLSLVKYFLMVSNSNFVLKRYSDIEYLNIFVCVLYILLVYWINIEKKAEFYCVTNGSRIEIRVSPEARSLLFFGWAYRISENFNGKGLDFKEMGVRACLCFVVILYTEMTTDMFHLS
jgi:hypothetical protein